MYESKYDLVDINWDEVNRSGYIHELTKVQRAIEETIAWLWGLEPNKVLAMPLSGPRFLSNIYADEDRTRCKAITIIYEEKDDD